MLLQSRKDFIPKPVSNPGSKVESILISWWGLQMIEIIYNACKFILVVGGVRLQFCQLWESYPKLHRLLTGR
jgi:hypothetical protein